MHSFHRQSSYLAHTYLNFCRNLFIPVKEATNSAVSGATHSHNHSHRNNNSTFLMLYEQVGNRLYDGLLAFYAQSYRQVRFYLYGCIKEAMTSVFLRSIRCVLSANVIRPLISFKPCSIKLSCAYSYANTEMHNIALPASCPYHTIASFYRLCVVALVDLFRVSLGNMCTFSTKVFFNKINA